MTLEEKFHAFLAEIEMVGQTAREYFDSDNTTSELKADGSAVTTVDKAIEHRIRAFIAKHFPDDAIVGEEEEGVEGGSGFVWHIDPIDGTDNFLRKIPFCAISVARLGDTAEDSFAVVHNPITKHTFSSFVENGVYENTRLARMTAETTGGRETLCIGRGRESWMRPAMYNILSAYSNRSHRGASYGSTALEFAYLAAGRIDVVLAYGLQTYDYAAGLYLVKVTGGQISVFADGAWHTWTDSIKELCAVHGRTILASHPDVHERMCNFIGDPRSWSVENS
jgi:myo-inositol-1(or 4)-monophosphatase